MSERLFRTMTFERAASATGGVGAVLATETPVRRNGYFEVLGCSAEDVDLRRAACNGLPLLHGHDHDGAIIGRVRDLKATGSALRGTLHPATNAKAREVWQDIQAGVASDLSVGYSVKEDSGKEIGRRDGLPVYRFKWAPFEVSVVNIPADGAAGIGRNIIQPKEEFQMTALRARMIPAGSTIRIEEPKKKLFRLGEAIESAHKRENPWPDGTTPGDRGTRIDNLCFEGCQRDLDSQGTGGFLVGGTQPTTAVEYLGAQLVTARAGAQLVPIDAGSFTALPRVTDPGSGHWISEGVAPTEGSMIFGQIALSMKNLAANVDYTRNLRVLSGGLAERVISREMFGVIARTLDTAALHGLGNSGQPMGVAVHSGVKSIDGGTFTAAKCADLINGPEAANAGALTAIMAPDVAELLRVRAENGTGSRFIFSDGKLLGSVPVIVSNSVSAGYIFVGDFSKMLIVQRSLELLIDPVTQSKTGIIQATIFWNGDVVLTHPACFAVAYSVT